MGGSSIKLINQFLALRTFAQIESFEMFGKPAEPATGGFSFGAPSGAITSSASGFGASVGAGAFGGAITNTPTTSLFGAASNANPQATANKPPSLSIMGANTATAPATGLPQGAGLFGQQQQIQTQNNPAIGTGGLFGGNVANTFVGNQQQQAQQQQPSLFGSQATQPTQSGGLFGSKPTPTGGGMFGGTNTGGGMFGGTNTGGSLFGQSNTATTTFGDGGQLGVKSTFGIDIQDV